MGIKEIYKSLEAKYYSVLDRIQTKVPIYKLIDPIDRVFPSFALLLIIVAVLIIAGLWIVIAGMQGAAAVSFSVVDDSGNALKDVTIHLAYGNETKQLKTDKEGKVGVELAQNTEVRVKVVEEGYETFEQAFTVKGAIFQYTITLKAPAVPPSEKTITFVGSAGEKLEGRSISVEVGCSNSGVAPLQTKYATNTGEIKVLPPVNCGNLVVVSITADGYQRKDSVVVDSDSKIIQLLAQEMPEGSIRVKVVDGEGNIISRAIALTLYSGDDVEKDKAFTDYGYGKLSAEPGSYYIVARDSENDYATARKNAEIELSEKTVTVAMTREIKGTFNITVADKANNAAIEGAGVNLKTADGRVIADGLADADGKISFSLFEDEDFLLTAMHEDYLYGAVNVSLASPNVTVKLEKLTPENSGIVEVRVKDEDEIAVENAEISLYNADTNFLAPYIKKVSDANGYVKFNGVKEGKYYARATKYPASGISGAKKINVRETTRLDVFMIVGTATVEVSAVDQDGKAVAFADAEFRSEGGEKLGTLELDADGKGSYTFKADKVIYVVAGASGYAGYTSLSYRLMPDEAIKVKAVLMPETVSGIVRVEYKGLRSANDKNVFDLVEKGKSYLVNLELVVPKGANYGKAGLHIRTGVREMREKDKLFISRINAPAAGIMKGTTFAPPLGYDADSANITEGYAKWANIEWNNPAEGIYSVQVEIKITDEAEAAEPLVFYYRAYGVDNGSYDRDPSDALLGSAESTAEKQALYAYAHEKTYYTSPPPELCSAEFCYYDSLLDLTERLYMDAPYRTLIFRDYNFTFTLQNNSSAVHNVSELRVRSTLDGVDWSEDIAINSYEFINADGQRITGDANGGHELPAVDLGNFVKNTAVRGTLFIKPMIVDNALLQLRVISDNIEVFERSVGFDTYATRGNLDVNVQPEKLAPYIGNELVVTVRKPDRERIEGALVRIIINDDGTKQAMPVKFTDSGGIARFTLGAQSPGTKIRVEVEKGGYNPAAVERNIDAQVIDIKPLNLAYEMNVRTASDVEKELAFNNLITQNLTISKLQVIGSFEGLLDEQTMNAWLGQYVGMEVVKGEERKVQVKAVLSSAGKAITKEKKLKGVVQIELSNPGYSVVWPQTVNLDFTITLGPRAEQASCLDIDLTEWETSLLDGTVSTGLTLRNYCQIEGQQVEVKDLQGEVVWKGTRLGEFQLELGGRAEILTSLKKAKFLDSIAPDEQVNGVLSFAPYAGHKGEIATADIKITGTILTGAGEKQVISTYPKESISAKIYITNLKDCITFDTAGGYLSVKSGSSGTFSISRESGEAGCGKIKMQFKLCADNSGGCNEIGVVPKAFYLNNDGDSKSITVDGTKVAGMHGIKVQVRPEGLQWRDLGWVKVKVAPKDSAQFELERYEVALLGGDGNAGAEYITVTNKKFIQKINVRAKKKSWDGYADEEYSSSAAMTEAFSYAAMGYATTILYAIAAGGLATVIEAGLVLGPAAAVAIVIFIFYLFYVWSQGKKYATHPMYDYITNLKLTDTDPSLIIGYGGDPNSIYTSRAGIDVRWTPETGQSDIVSPLETSTETMGIKFSKTAEIEEQFVYTKIRLKVYRNCYNDPQTVGSPRPYQIDAGCGKREYFEDFSIQVDLSDEADLLFLKELKGMQDKGSAMFAEDGAGEIEEALFATEEDETIVGGDFIRTGKTGEEALPKIKLSWDWKHIEWDSCDAENPDAVYCDAAQFSIALMKRINRLDEWLKANNYSFECPTHPLSKWGAGSGSSGAGNSVTRTVSPKMIGISSVSKSYASGKLTLNIGVQNNTDGNHTVTVNFDLITPSGSEESAITCSKTFIVPANSSASTKCEFSGLSETKSNYQATTSISSSTADATELDDTAVDASFNTTAGLKAGQCWMPKTSRTLEKFINKDIPFWGKFVNSTPKWTDEITGFGDLRKTLDFNALLMKDGYGMDFRNDFHELYSKESFFNAPSFYLDEERGLWKYLKEGWLIIGRDYANNAQLVLPGKYRVQTMAVFAGSNWDLFDKKGEPQAPIVVQLALMETPKPTNAFYYLPIDGMLGKTEKGWSREGYGTVFDGNVVKISDGTQAVSTYADYDSKPYASADVVVKDDFVHLNKDIRSRGNLLRIDVSGEREKVVFSPGYATPVIMKVSADEKGKKATAEYTMNEQRVPKDSGYAMQFWNGVGACYDFSGKLVGEAFDHAYDEALDADKNSYGIVWNAADVKKLGNVYLKAVFYTSRNYDNVLNAAGTGSRVVFITPDMQDGSKSVGLNGISTMEHNRKGIGDTDTIDSISDIFELVRQGKVAVTNHGTSIDFWWNPDALEKQKVGGKSMESIENAITDCIGS